MKRSKDNRPPAAAISTRISSTRQALWRVAADSRLVRSESPDGCRSMIFLDRMAYSDCSGDSVMRFARRGLVQGHDQLREIVTVDILDDDLPLLVAGDV